MNRKRLFNTAAFSALMLAAVASPVIANAAAAPTLISQYAASQAAAEAKPVPASALTAVAKPIALADPLALAKQYAPDTAPDWERTLARYDELAKSKIKTLTLSADRSGSATLVATAAAVPAGTGAVALSDTQTVKPGERTKAGEAKPLPIAASTGAGTVAFRYAGEIKEGAPIREVKKLETVKAVPAGDAQVTLPALTIATTSGTAPGVGSLFQDRIALNDAAESKDAAKIKEALAKLLQQYKTQIEKWEQDK